MTLDNVKLVKVTHAYKGLHNDELSLEPGDVITVTQAIEGGWWEGTLSDTTGWFPSSYVQEIQGYQTQNSNHNDCQSTIRESTIYYHSVVLKNIIDSEKSFIVELQDLLQTKLKPIGNAGILTVAEYNYLHGNIEDLCNLHINLLASFDECIQVNLANQRIGRVFMNAASSVRRVYIDYYGNHPRAVNVLLNKKDELIRFLSTLPRRKPDTDDTADNDPPTDSSIVLALTAALATPFSRLERYPQLLKELERHTDKSHVDRGDTQRAKNVYEDILEAAVAMRNQKELEFDVMQCHIEGLDADKLALLGGLIRASHVLIFSDECEESLDRLFLLFPGVLVTLQFNSRHSGYLFDNRMAISNLTTMALEDCDSYSNAFSLSVKNMADKQVVACSSPGECLEWLTLLKHHQQHNNNGTTGGASVQMRCKSPGVDFIQPTPATHKVVSSSGVVSSSATLPRKTKAQSCQKPPLPSMKPLISSASLSSSSSSSTTASAMLRCQKATSSPPHMKTLTAAAASTATLPRTNSTTSQRSVNCVKGSSDYRNQQVWLQSCLRPSPPLHPAFRDGQANTTARNTLTTAARRKTVDENNMDNGSYLLKVLEAYCWRKESNHRKTIHSIDLSKLSKRRSQAVGEINRSYSQEDKPFDLLCGIPANQGDNNKFLMDVIHRLKDQIRDVKMEQGKLRKEMQFETASRKRLELYVTKNLRVKPITNQPAN